ncbi:Dehydrogenase with different specificities (related to short-chain alcohol dehydrogenase) [Streptococcus criceti]|uniref:SDR family NAD(P)-dependent oxidoreductase n=1 Tax=Streptococcus criceti TaxID=1333 RepID=UPI000225C8A0|nr:Dehydrogenase with different specificities (related to short-chain alcohol dehydrogenase) [Streptococcus criceti]
MTKTILITGSTDSIGKHLATKLASQGHEIVLYGRNSKNCREWFRKSKRRQRILDLMPI